MPTEEEAIIPENQPEGLRWSVEELGFPEQHHGDASSVTAGNDHGFSAAGHHRAAGMRI